jgi:putative ABC transport system substrate-binding protein
MNRACSASVKYATFPPRATRQFADRRSEFVIMRRREFIAMVAGSAAARPLAAGAQQSGKVYRIGVLLAVTRSTRLSPQLQAFEDGLRDLGLIEGRNLTIERRFADGNLKRLPALAAELVASNLHVIVVVGPGPMQATRAATATIPIVMLAASSDPVGEGLIASFARPGGNITGLTYAVSAERFGKQLEMLREAAGRISRVAVLWDLEIELYRRSWAPALGEAARDLGLELQGPFQVRSADDIEHAFAAMATRRTEAVLVVAGSINFGSRARIGELATRLRLPVMAAFRDFPQTGSLMSYGPNFPAVFRRGAHYVDMILKGAKPADLPVEQPTLYDLVINLKSAKALGLTIPLTLLARADEVIE